MTFSLEPMTVMTPAWELRAHMKMFHGIYIPTRELSADEVLSIIEVHDLEHVGKLAWECVTHDHGKKPEPAETDADWQWGDESPRTGKRAAVRGPVQEWEW